TIKFRRIQIISAYSHYLPLEQLKSKIANTHESVIGHVVGRIELKGRPSIIWGKIGAFQLLGSFELLTLIYRKSSESFLARHAQAKLAVDGRLSQSQSACRFLGWRRLGFRHFRGLRPEERM